MPEYGFAIISTDKSFVPAEDALIMVEEALRALQIIGERLPKRHEESAVVSWAVGPGAPSYLPGNPTTISIYVGEPTPFFDGHAVRAHARFILEVEDGDPSALKEVLEAALRTELEVLPYRF